MSRRLGQQFVCDPLAKLARQLLIGPLKKRIDQVRRTEKLYDEIDPQRNYPFDFVNFRITRYRSESETGTTLVGDALAADLRLLIDLLSRSVGMPHSPDEPIVTPAELAGELGVSTKTVERWRKAGLRWRWVEPPGATNGRRGRKQLVFTRDAVEQFLAQHADLVDRARRYTLIDDATRRALLTDARKLASEPGMSIYRVARRLARSSGRSVEAMRQLLDKHDRDNEDARIFVDHTAPLTHRQKKLIQRARDRGVPVARIADHLRRSSVTIHRVIRRQRADVITAQRIDYAEAPTFRRDDADEVLLRPLPAEPSPAERPQGLDTALADLQQPMAAIYDRPLLEARFCRTLLVRMNYLKYKSDLARQAMSRHDPAAQTISDIEAWLAEAAELRKTLITGSLPHVLLIARQHIAAADPGPAVRLIELLQLGNEQLFDAVDQFDITLDRSFVSYLTWSLKRRFARYEPDPTKARRRMTDDEIAAQLLEDAQRDLKIDLRP